MARVLYSGVFAHLDMYIPRYILALYSPRMRALNLAIAILRLARYGACRRNDSYQLVYVMITHIIPTLSRQDRDGSDARFISSTWGLSDV